MSIFEEYGAFNNWIDMLQQTVYTQIKLLLKEQFDLSLHCLLVSQHYLDT